MCTSGIRRASCALRRRASRSRSAARSISSENLERRSRHRGAIRCARCSTGIDPSASELIEPLASSRACRSNLVTLRIALHIRIDLRDNRSQTREAEPAPARRFPAEPCGRGAQGALGEALSLAGSAGRLDRRDERRGCSAAPAQGSVGGRFGRHGDVAADRDRVVPQAEFDFVDRQSRRLELHQHIDKAIHAPEQRDLLEQQDPAVVREDLRGAARR